MLPFIAAGLVGGYLLKSIFSDSGSSSGSNSYQEKLDKNQEFLLIFANILFRIDGTLHKNEKDFLDEYEKFIPDDLKKKIEKSRSSSETYSILNKQYKALDKKTRGELNSKFFGLAALDDEVSESEEAALIQLSQIINEGERLQLYIACKEESENILLEHDLFEYITLSDWSSKFPNSMTNFSVDQIYTPHPFIDKALMPFTLQDFEDCQSDFFKGIIPILKELGASRVYISESKEQFDSFSNNFNVESSVGLKKIKASASLSNSSEINSILECKTTVEVKFDGKGFRFFDKLFPSFLHKKLRKKFINNPEYITLIENRFGSNKINYFEYQMKSKIARNLAISINSAASLNSSLVKANASLENSFVKNHAEFKEKYFRAEFH